MARGEAGEILRDADGKSVKAHKTGCRPRWEYVFDAGRGGKRKQLTKGGFLTKREAQRALTEALEAFEKGTFVTTGRLTVAEYLHDWLEGRASLRPTTRLSYESHVRLYLSPALGNVRLDDLRSVHVDRLFAELRRGRAKQLSPATLQRVRATLNSALNDAVRKGLLRANPARYVDLPPVVRPDLNVWTLAELRHFLIVRRERSSGIAVLAHGQHGAAPRGSRRAALARPGPDAVGVDSSSAARPGRSPGP